jgi:hypothetical protein
MLNNDRKCTQNQIFRPTEFVHLLLMLRTSHQASFYGRFSLRSVGLKRAVYVTPQEAEEAFYANMNEP